MCVATVLIAAVNDSRIIACTCAIVIYLFWFSCCVRFIAYCRTYLLSDVYRLYTVAVAIARCLCALISFVFRWYALWIYVASIPFVLSWPSVYAQRRCVDDHSVDHATKMFCSRCTIVLVQIFHLMYGLTRALLCIFSYIRAWLACVRSYAIHFSILLICCAPIWVRQRCMEVKCDAELLIRLRTVSFSLFCFVRIKIPIAIH